MLLTEGPKPEEDEFVPPDEPEMAESSREDPLEGPSDDLLLPLLASFSDISRTFFISTKTKFGSIILCFDFRKKNLEKGGSPLNKFNPKGDRQTIVMKRLQGKNRSIQSSFACCHDFEDDARRLSGQRKSIPRQTMLARAGGGTKIGGQTTQ